MSRATDPVSAWRQELIGRIDSVVTAIDGDFIRNIPNLSSWYEDSIYHKVVLARPHAVIIVSLRNGEFGQPVLGVDLWGNRELPRLATCQIATELTAARVLLPEMIKAMAESEFESCI